MSDKESRSPLLVLISGKPGSGKSTLARQLTAEGALWLPLVSCDPLRNGIRTTLAGLDGSPVVRPGKEAVDLFYDTIAFLLARRVSLIAELSLRRGLDEAPVSALMALCEVRNIHCLTATAIAQQRFVDRQALRSVADDTGAHVSAMRDGTFDWTIFAPLDLPLLRLLVNTADGYDPPLAEIVAFCRQT